MPLIYHFLYTLVPLLLMTTDKYPNITFFLTKKIILYLDWYCIKRIKGMSF